MDSGSNILGNRVTGISSASWYSIQAFASDYYLGLNGTSTDTPVAAQLSDIEDPSLWQFIAAGPDTNGGVYALRSKSAEGRFCLYEGCGGSELCTAPPVVQPCDNGAGQFQLRNSSSEGGGVIFVTPAGRSALSAFGGSSEGDAVDSVELAVSNAEEGGYLWAIRVEEEVDDAAYPVTFTPTYAVPSNTANATTSTTQTASSTTGDQGPSTITQTVLTTTVPEASATASDSSPGMPSSTSEPTTGTTTSPASESSAPAQQTGSTASRTGLSVNAVLAGLACLSLLGVGM